MLFWFFSWQISSAFLLANNKRRNVMKNCRTQLVKLSFKPSHTTVLSYRHTQGSPHTHPDWAAESWGKVGSVLGKHKGARGSDEVILTLEGWGNRIPGGWADRSLELVPRMGFWTSWSLCLSIWPFSDLEKGTRALEFSVIKQSVMNQGWKELPR